MWNLPTPLFGAKVQPPKQEEKHATEQSSSKGSTRLGSLPSDPTAEEVMAMPLRLTEDQRLNLHVVLHRGAAVWTTPSASKASRKRTPSEGSSTDTDANPLIDSVFHPMEGFLLCLLTFSGEEYDVALALRLAKLLRQSDGVLAMPTHYAIRTPRVRMSFLEAERSRQDHDNPHHICPVNPEVFREGKLIKDVSNVAISWALCERCRRSRMPLTLKEGGRSISDVVATLKDALMCAGHFDHMAMGTELMEFDGVRIRPSNGDGESVPVISRETRLAMLLHGTAIGGQKNSAFHLIERMKVSADVEDSASRTPFAFAIRGGHSDYAHMLLRRYKVRPGYVTAKGRTALHLAAKYGHVDLLKELIRLKLDVNLADNFRTLPIHEACLKGNLSCVQALFESGADLNIPDGNGRNCIHVATTANRVEVVEYMIQCGGVDASLPLAPRGGATPLHLAVISGHSEMVMMLLQNGADPKARTTDGQTPYQCEKMLGRLNGAARYALLATEKGQEVVEDDGIDEGWETASSGSIPMPEE